MIWIVDGNNNLFAILILSKGNPAILPHERHFETGQKVTHRKRMRMDDRRIEPLLLHERRRTVRCALALTTYAVKVDIIAHEIGDVD